MVDSAATKSVSTAFGAVVGQDRLKEALLTVATDDGLDGLLVSGEKGTAKSTLVRGLAALLPEQRAVADCPYGCPPGDRRRQCEDCRRRASYPVETRPAPLVTLPLGATRERVVGALSVPDALAGEAEFEPGLLARANRGLLYVDEVNLLEDHLVDVLLDAAASGVNRVERDGVSVTHPAAFTLVGTMNPEEGDLRPQLRDRFALSVEVAGERDVADRVAIIESDLRETASASTARVNVDGGRGDADGGSERTAEHRERLRRGRELLAGVELTGDQKRGIAELCQDAGVEGHRGDIATARAARALAALDGRPTVTDGDLRRAASFALGHRMRSAPFEDAPDAEEVIDDHLGDATDGAESADGDDGGADFLENTDVEGAESVGSDGNDDAGADSDVRGPPDVAGSDADEGRRNPDGQEPDPTADGADGAAQSQTAGDRPEDGSPTGAVARTDPGEAGGEDHDAENDRIDRGSDAGEENDESTPRLPGQSRRETGVAAAAVEAPDVDAPSAESADGTGRADPGAVGDGRGARVRTEPADGGADIDAAASVRAAASRGSDSVETRDLRRSVRSGDGEALVVFAVDASASMRPAMRRAKGVALELLEDAYTRRDSVAVVAFAGADAEVLLPPTDSVGLAARHLKELPTGDRTPLPAGLRTAAEVVDRADPCAAAVVVVSDGRANADDQPTAETRAAAEALARTDAHVVCVDVGDERGLLPEVVAATGGRRVPLDDLTPERVERAVAAARR